MPRRPPIDPEGTYHVSSRGSYGQPLFRTPDEHELFLSLYLRVSRKYGWITLAWVLMGNHHHFVIRQTNGGLSDGMRELHGSFSRRIHAIYGLTNQGHLVRHAFFARQLKTDADVISACAYVDMNPSAERATPKPRATDWCGYAATLGLAHPRAFHSPAALLELCGTRPAAARRAYRELVESRHAQRGQDPSPNHGYGSATAPAGGVIRSVA